MTWVKELVGLSTDEGIDDRLMAAYEHVLLNDDWCLESLAAALDADAGEVGPLLDGLVSLGLLRTSQERPEEFTPVAPAVGLRSVIERAEATLHRHTVAVEQLRGSAGQVMEHFEEHRLQQRSSRFEVLPGRDAAVRRVGELVDRATREVGSLVTSPPTAQALEQARAADERLLARGVRSRTLYLEAHRRQSPALREYLGWLRGAGGEVRTASVLPSRMLFVDRRTALVALDPAAPAAGALVVHTPGLVNLVVTLFDVLWDQSAELTSERRDTDADFTDLEVTVVRLLAQGLKDEAVSRRTGLSLRSVRRTVASVGDRLGTQSRFELGVKCRDLGLL